MMYDRLQNNLTTSIDKVRNFKVVWSKILTFQLGETKIALDQRTILNRGIIRYLIMCELQTTNIVISNYSAYRLKLFCY